MTIDEIVTEYRTRTIPEPWREALLIACAVEPDTGHGQNVARTTFEGKVSAREFARRVDTSADRVLRYLRAWELAAADDGLVPHAETLTPDDTERVAMPAPDLWSAYLRRASTTKRPSTGRRAAPPPAPEPEPPSSDGSPDAGARAAGAAPKIGHKARQADDPRVVEWVRRALERGLDREQMIASSGAGEDDWPLPVPLTGNTHQAALAILTHAQRLGIKSLTQEGAWVTEPRRVKAQIRKQRAELAQRRAAGRPERVYGVANDVLRALATVSAWDVRDLELDGLDRDDAEELGRDLAMLLDHLGALAEWTDDAILGVMAQVDDSTVLTKITKLRETNGRTPAEVITARKLADNLEAKLVATRSSRKMIG